MIHFDLPKEQSSIIKVIGVGGGGSNAVNYMFSQNYRWRKLYNLQYRRASHCAKQSAQQDTVRASSDTRAGCRCQSFHWKTGNRRKPRGN